MSDKATDFRESIRIDVNDVLDDLREDIVLNSNDIDDLRQQITNLQIEINTLKDILLR